MNKGCFITNAELEFLREKYSKDGDLVRVFNHIDALEALIREESENYENLVNDTTDDWADVGSYICDADSLIKENEGHIEALGERIKDLETIRDINKADAILMSQESMRLMRKVPYKAR